MCLNTSASHYNEHHYKVNTASGSSKTNSTSTQCKLHLIFFVNLSPAALSQSCFCGTSSIVCRRIRFRAPVTSRMEYSSVPRTTSLGETCKVSTNLLTWGAIPQRRYKPSTFKPKRNKICFYLKFPCSILIFVKHGSCSEYFSLKFCSTAKTFLIII